MKNFRLKKIEKVFLRLQNIKISEFSTYYFEKLNFFLSKNHLAFFTIERYDIELTNIKILDENIVPLGGRQAPESELFLLLF